MDPRLVAFPSPISAVLVISGGGCGQGPVAAAAASRHDKDKNGNGSAALSGPGWNGPHFFAQKICGRTARVFEKPGSESGRAGGSMLGFKFQGPRDEVRDV